MEAILKITISLPEKIEEEGKGQKLNIIRTNRIQKISEALECEPPVLTLQQSFSLLS